MRTFGLLLLSVALVACEPRAADQCTSDKCRGPTCYCASTSSPLPEQDPLEDTPQFVVISVDDAVVDLVYTSYLEPLLIGRQNRDGNPISATFYVPHEYTDYSRVQQLYLNNFEIGVNSISKSYNVTYWRTASAALLQQEFGGQRTLISHFAQIPIDDIVGARTPELQLEGDVSIQAYQDSGIKFDNSWTTRSTRQLFPYTLDYLSNQECTFGNTCPQEAHEGFWVAPVTNIQGPALDSPIECNSLLNCEAEGTPEQIRDWLLDQFDRFYSGNRAPLTILLSSSWLSFQDSSFDGFRLFLDQITSSSYPDVYLVSQSQVIDYMRNPVTASQYRTTVPERTGTGQCNPINCQLTTLDGNIRYMKVCTACPEIYPWVGNPLGQANPSQTTRPPPVTTRPPPVTTQPPPITEDSGQ